MIITPRISEKSYGLSKQNIYVFDVPMSANKAEVARELVSEYPDIEISDIRLVITKGKVKSVNRGKRARPGLTKRSDSKKAYVTVSKGKIDVFKDLTGSEEK